MCVGFRGQGSNLYQALVGHFAFVYLFICICRNQNSITTKNVLLNNNEKFRQYIFKIVNREVFTQLAGFELHKDFCFHWCSSLFI